MLEKLICSTSTILGLIIIIIHVINYKYNRLVNVYFIFIIFLNTLRSITISVPEVVFLSRYQSQIVLFLKLYGACLFYLYLKKIIYNQKTYTIKELVHFIAPSLLLVICYFEDQNKAIFPFHLKFHFLILITLYVAYISATVILIVKKVLRRNGNFLVMNSQNKEIKKWILLLFSLFMLLFLKSMYVLVFNDNQDNFYFFTALIWTILYVKILCTPEFLYGYEMYSTKNKDLKKNEIVFDNIWIFDNTNQINAEDVLLKEKIKINIVEYIIGIENIALNTEFFLDDTIKIRELANKLNIPKSHLKYIFKYHSTISFIDFKVLVRIQKATQLIKQGYLKTNKFESLATKVGFSSYSPFFKHFKSVTGMSPNEFKRSNAF